MTILTGILIVTMLSTGCGSVRQVARQSGGHSENLQTEGQKDLEEPLRIQVETEGETGGEEKTAMKMNVQVGDSTFTATLENNTAVDAFVKMMDNGPVVIQMSDYSGFEKVGPLGANLPASNSRITTQAGDIVLYNGNQIVIFYGSNAWSYTKLGKIDDLSGWEEALGSGDVTVAFSVA